MKIAVVTPDPRHWLHMRAFDEVADALVEGLRDAGHDVERCLEPAAERVNVLFGAQFVRPEVELPARTVLFNLEQVVAGSIWLNEAYVARLRRHVVWDYSARNVEALRGLGVARAVLVPIGHARCLERITPAAEDVDLVFYGRYTERRTSLLRRLASRGWHVRMSNAAYGEERDREIARARIILNIHFGEESRLEVARCFYAMINGRFILSEVSPDAEESGLTGGLALARYDEIEERCAWYLAHPEERAAIASAGQALMRSRPQASLLREALESLAG